MVQDTSTRPGLLSSGRRRFAAVLAAAGLALAGLGVISVAQAAATNPFLIDGTVPDAGAFQFDDPEGNAQELGPVNSNLTKLGVIHSAVPPMLSTTNPNAQVDLRQVWLDTKKDPEDNAWLYFAWERDSNRGSGVIMYEFQQDPRPAGCDYTEASPYTNLMAGCNPWENRQPGDFVIVWDQSGNTINIILRTWSGPAGWEKGDPLSLDAGVSLTGNGNAFAALSPDNYRGEAAVNLTATIFAGVQSCTTIGNVIPGTVTGNSDTADYKDTVLAPIADYLTISNCGSVTVTKVTDPADGTGNFDWALDRFGGGAIRYAADGYEGTELTSATGTLTEDGDSETVVDLIAGTDYTLEETFGADTPYDLTSIVCTAEDGTDYTVTTAGSTFPVVEGETTDCVITNALQQGTLIVTKVVVNDNGGTLEADDFSFTVDGGSAVAFEADGTNEMTVDQGSYDVLESGVPIYGYSTSYANGEETDCTDVYVPAGGSATCTITNDDIQPTLTLLKTVVNDNGGTLAVADFPLFVDTTAVTSGATNGFNAGSYTASETPQTGYTPSGWGGDCAADGSVTLAVGDAKTCTITNDDTKASPAGTTLMTWVLHDQLTISGLRAGAPDAATSTVTFRLYTDDQCTGTPIGTEEDSTIVSGVASTTNGIAVVLEGTYYWTAQYSGDQFNNGFSTTCGSEVTQITDTYDFA